MSVEFKEFKLIDYFNISYGKFVKQNKVGKIPYITTSAFNNGIGGSVEGEPMFKGNCITIASDGSVGSTFYQEHPFSASNIVVVLEPKDKTPLNRYNAQFLATKIRIYAEQEFDYGKKYSVNRVRDTSLKLPVTEYGEVDWDYMENYMKSIEDESENIIDLLNKVTLNEGGITLEPQVFSTYKIEDIFKVSGTKSKNMGQIKFVEDGEFEFVGRTGKSNGVQGYVNEMEYEPNQGGTISISQVGTILAQYRKNPYYTSQNIAKLESKYEVGEEVLHYIVTLINKGLTTGGFVGYTTPKLKDIKEIEMKLPITETGDIDWEYMEEFMKYQEEMAKNKLELLGLVLEGV